MTFAQDRLDSLHSPVHVGIVYPVSSNGRLAPEYSNNFSLHLFSGISKSEYGAAISGFANVVRESGDGAMVAGFANFIGRSDKAAQIAGFGNFVKGDAKGLQTAGFMNRAKQVNTQIAGFINFAEGAKGAQVAGFGNMAASNVRGAQVSGFINKADTVDTQVAGFINIAKRVNGAQVAGFINIAESSDYPIGLVNIIKDGEMSISATFDETMTGLISFRSGGRKLYGIVGVGYNFKGLENDLYAMEAGIGMHIPLWGDGGAGSVRINTELTGLSLTDFNDWDFYRSSLRILPAFRINKNFEVFAGPSFNYLGHKDGLGNGLIENFIWERVSGDRFHGNYIGYTGGVNFIF